jgi:tetratricopeptide (TPR) repeat protein
MKKKSFFLLISAIIFITVIAGGFLYYFKVFQINYLIPGVPYNGIYNLYFRNANLTSISSVMDIFGYWGDKRFSIDILREKFSDEKTATSSFSSAKSFFEENGYETYEWLSPEPGGEISQIKKFVNPSKKIPVIVFQKNAAESIVSGFKVIIGVFDGEKKIVIHDHYFGNNYEMSYDDFENMFTGNSRAILAVWPKEELLSQIDGPNYNVSYPSRSETMDKVGNFLAIKQAEIIYYLNINDYQKVSASLKEFIENPIFEKNFPIFFQLQTISTLASTYAILNQADEAIKIINEQVLPLNHDLNQPSQDWFIPDQKKLVVPYYILALSYLEKGEKALALNNYKEMLKIKDEAIKENGGIDDFGSFYRVEELEKEISSKK